MIRVALMKRVGTVTDSVLQSPRWQLIDVS